MPKPDKKLDLNFLSEKTNTYIKNHKKNLADE